MGEDALREVQRVTMFKEPYQLGVIDSMTTIMDSE